jgi:hypothetical protein
MIRRSGGSKAIEDPATKPVVRIRQQPEKNEHRAMFRPRSQAPHTCNKAIKLDVGLVGLDGLQVVVHQLPKKSKRSKKGREPPRFRAHKCIMKDFCETRPLHKRYWCYYRCRKATRLQTM